MILAHINVMSKYVILLKTLFCLIAQVSTDGYLSFGRPISCCPSLISNTSTSDYIVAPFEADANIASGRGEVSYEVHSDSTSPDQLSRVNNFIRQEKQNSFAGTWMLVVEWRDVPQSGQVNSVVREIKDAYKAANSRRE